MTFSTERRVEFRDTDAAGIVHFSAFFPMMEAAEHEFLRSLGLSVMPGADGDSPPVTWPRVAATCNYLAAAHFEDILRISVRVVKIGKTSVAYAFGFSRDGQAVAEGTMTAVCCRMPEIPRVPLTGGLQKTPIPDPIRELLSQGI